MYILAIETINQHLYHIISLNELTIKWFPWMKLVNSDMIIHWISWQYVWRKLSLLSEELSLLSEGYSTLKCEINQTKACTRTALGTMSIQLILNVRYCLNLTTSCRVSHQRSNSINQSNSQLQNYCISYMGTNKSRVVPYLTSDVTFYGMLLDVV